MSAMISDGEGGSGEGGRVGRGRAGREREGGSGGGRPVTDMWTCPRCGRGFAGRNQVHTCAPLGDLDEHFTHASPLVRATFDEVLAAVTAVGPVDVLPEK